MKYNSTRGFVSGKSFEETLFTGFTAYGDLFLPDHIPKIDTNVLVKWKTFTYQKLVAAILKLFIANDEIPHEEIETIIEDAFEKFTHPQIIPVKKLENGLNVAEMFHGPSLAFKDISFSIVSKLANYFLSKRKKHCVSLISTSGDTGAAALEAFSGTRGLDLIILIPKNYISRVQELFMTTVISSNCHVVKAEGTSDDLDSILRDIVKDEHRPRNLEIMSFNSINWGRVLGQISVYFWYYFQMCDECTDVVEIIVPTGGGGSISAGSIAALMGLPIRITSTVNVNNTFYKIIENGVLSASGKVIATLACAMDIQMPYNVERLLYLYSGCDGNFVRDIMNKFHHEGTVSLPEKIVEKMQSVLKCHTKVHDDEIITTMQRCFKENDYLICPHTATAVAYHYKYNGSHGKRICFATASPDKFEEAVEQAKLPKSGSILIENLHKKPEKFVDMKLESNWLPFIKSTLQAIEMYSDKKSF